MLNFFLLNFFCPPILQNYNLYKYLAELFWLCLILFRSTVFVKFFPILHTSFKILTLLLHSIYLVSIYLLVFNNFISSFIWFKFIFSFQNFAFSWFKIAPSPKVSIYQIRQIYTHIFCLNSPQCSKYRKIVCSYSEKSFLYTYSVFCIWAALIEFCFF